MAFLLHLFIHGEATKPLLSCCHTIQHLSLLAGILYRGRRKLRVSSLGAHQHSTLVVLYCGWYTGRVLPDTLRVASHISEEGRTARPVDAARHSLAPCLTRASG
jgi:hypothetical protein